MFFCNRCQKEVIFYSVNYSQGVDSELDNLRDRLEQEGKLILFNPPPLGHYNCPHCWSELEEK
ncbi:hypothetical protein LCGC14_0802750 [marine sediment metagenome]|uniref:Uncharacterized protein n=1 Tax=marine sediment metagenome TaxID=412755 RepID=A0A0F9SWD4_9ZZZZ|nr:MAG: hypothetical protein Lokiarch_18670 [Candidatus Lokiarchaeum sp. GC14_75]